MSRVKAAFDIHQSCLVKSFFSIDRVIFIFLPIISFLNIFDDLTYLFLS